MSCIIHPGRRRGAVSIGLFVYGLPLYSVIFIFLASPHGYMTAALCFPYNSMKFVSTAVLVRRKVLLTSLEPSHSLSFFNFFSLFTSHDTQCIEKKKKKQNKSKELAA
jgi:hypothetical protein